MTTNKLLVDVSHLLNSQVLPYPNDPSLSITPVATVESDGFSNYLINTGMHVGTHVDGVAHFMPNSGFISSVSLDTFYGEALLLDVQGAEVVTPLMWMDKLDFEGKIVLIHTGHDKKWGSSSYFETHPVLSVDFAQWLINKGVKLVGIDMPSPDKEPFEVHKLLLSKGVLLLENLTNLSQLIDFKKLTLMAFPLKIETDSSLVRAVVLAEN